VVRYRVAHPLYAEVAYAELTAGERRRTHAELVRALDERVPDDVVALAPHYRGAGDLVDPQRMLDVLASAGERALALHADVEAAQWLDAAIDQARQLGHTTLLPDLLDFLGQACERIGEGDRAAAAWRDAVDRADPVRVGVLSNRLAILEWERGDISAAARHLQRALDAPVPPGGAAVEQLLRMMMLSRAHGYESVVRVTALLKVLAERHPSPVTEGLAHNARADLAFLARDFPAAGIEAQRASSLFAGSGLPLAAGLSHRAVTIAALAVGDLADARRAADALLVFTTDRLGIPALACSARLHRAAGHFLAGDWAAAAADLDSVVALGQRLGSAARGRADLAGVPARPHRRA